MKGLHDNAGEYDPDRKLEDFSTEFLANLAREYARAYLAMDGFWNGAVTQGVGMKEAMECELVVWQRIANYMASQDRQAGKYPAAGKGPY